MEPLLLLGETKRLLLEELLAGPRGAPDLARSVGIEVNAVRKHLDSLERMGAVRYEFLRMGTGRPRKRYRLGPAGLELFPRRYDLLFSRLLDTLLRKEGEAYVGAMLAGIAREVAGGIAIPADAPPGERLEALTGALNDLGFRPAWRPGTGVPASSTATASPSGPPPGTRASSAAGSTPPSSRPPSGGPGWNWRDASSGGTRCAATPSRFTH